MIVIIIIIIIMIIIIIIITIMIITIMIMIIIIMIIIIMIMMRIINKFQEMQQSFLEGIVSCKSILVPYLSKYRAHPCIICSPVFRRFRTKELLINLKKPHLTRNTRYGI